jgi:epoxyqueuosine reductase
VDLEAFFRVEGIDVFAGVGILDLPEQDRESVLQWFPAAQSVIVFGREVPVRVYLLPPREKTREMLRIAEGLDTSAVRLADLLNSEHIPALSVPLYMPVRIVNGQVQGMVRLKHVAVAGRLGSMGMNSLLLSPRYGPRLLLSGIVTARPVQLLFPEHEKGTRSAATEPLQCMGCRRCLRVCPEGALGPEGVDAFRCRTVRTWIPPPLVPAVKFLLGRTVLQKTLAPFAPWIARAATIRCSLCVTECPKFVVTTGEEGLSVPVSQAMAK